MNKELKENLVYKINDKSEDRIIFNSLTYYEIVKGILVEFGNKSQEEVEIILLNSDFFSKENYPPKSYNQVALLDHEEVYHIAMLVGFGEGYWRKESGKSISSVPPLNFYDWMQKYIKENNLKADYIEYLD